MPDQAIETEAACYPIQRPEQEQRQDKEDEQPWNEGVADSRWHDLVRLPAKSTGAVKGTAPARFLVEVSGGITLDTVRSYADAGANLISTSVITQSAPALDLAFDLRNDPRPKER